MGSQTIVQNVKQMRKGRKNYQILPETNTRGLINIYLPKKYQHFAKGIGCVAHSRLLSEKAQNWDIFSRYTHVLLKVAK